MAKLVLDVSNNNGTVNWDQVFAPGKVAGIYQKASQGTHFTDKFWGTARAACARHGIPFGGYHFFEPTSDAEAQADHFCAIIQKLNRTDLRPWLDFETGGFSPVVLTNQAHAFSKRVKEHLGVYPMVYTDSGFLSNFTEMVGDGLALANYGADDGNEHPFPTPSPWKHAVMHQFTDKGHWPGIGGFVDMSFCHGRLPYAHPWLVRLP